MADSFVFLFALSCILLVGLNFSLADVDVFQCEESCESGVSRPAACKRGCRFFSLINFINDFTDLNDTLTACKSSCDEAHPFPECQSSCAVGCQSQLPLTQAYRQRMEELKGPLDLYISPFSYMNQMYSNMVENVHSQISISWSVYVQPNQGTIVIVRSEPSIVQFSDWNINRGDESKTSNYVETNLAENDNSATPDLKSSQLHMEGRSIDVSSDSVPGDWLACVSRKSGVPRSLLAGLLISCFLFIAYICLSASFYSPERRSSEKLSIYGDLDHLHIMDDADSQPFLVKVKAQDLGAEVAPLPIKIKIENV